MKTLKTIAMASAFTAFAVGGAALAAEHGKATAPGQIKATGQPAAPAAKTTAPGQSGVKPDTLGSTVSSDCAKLTDPKAKDDCVKNAKAAN